MQYIIGVITGFIGLIAIALLLSFLLAWPVMMLWNGCLVPAVEGIKEIGWLQAPCCSESLQLRKINMENKKEMADREQVLEQAFAAATQGNMDQAFALVGNVANDMLASRNELFERMGLFSENNLTNKD
jgi:hypothetical protein